MSGETVTRRSLEALVDALRRDLPELRKRYPVASLAVFGSWVRGEQRLSLIHISEPTRQGGSRAAARAAPADRRPDHGRGCAGVSRDVGEALADMVRYAETAIRLVGTLTLEQLQADERTSLALERAIEILGEAAGRVPQEWRERHPELPWREMVGIRNRLAHACFATELFILHEITTKLLPPLLPILNDIVRKARQPQG
jgi:uncharacterized protein with HEPN domain